MAGCNRGVFFNYFCRSLVCRSLNYGCRSLLAAIVFGGGLLSSGLAEEPAVPAGMKLAWQDDFDDQAAERYQPTDSTSWAMRKEAGNSFISLTKKKSDFTPRFRSPFNRALLKGHAFGSFVLDIKAQSTIADYPHRDLCLFFGYQDDEHLYYVHLGKRTDDHANQIFIVNDAPRTKISTKTTPGTTWTDGWHNVRVVRDIKDGKIEVFFDNMDEPVMTAQDTSFGKGRIGFGSFDDTGNFDDLRVYTPAN